MKFQSPKETIDFAFLLQSRRAVSSKKEYTASRSARCGYPELTSRDPPGRKNVFLQNKPNSPAFSSTFLRQAPVKPSILSLQPFSTPDSAILRELAKRPIALSVKYK
jgi:hypothetical protein